MRKFLLLAFRNVFRNRRRTLLTLVVVAGGVAGLLLVGGFFSFMFTGLRESTIRNGLGHLQIYNANYLRRVETRALENGIDDWRQVVASVSGLQHVRGATPRIEFSGLVSNGMKSSVFMGSAIDPAAERAMGFAPSLAAGRDLDGGSAGGNEALLGAGLARSLNVKVGDGLTLLAVTANGALNGIDIDVVGVVTTGFKEMDDRLLRITVPAAQRLLETERVTKLVVGLDSTNRTDKVYREIASRVAGLQQEIAIKKWIELATFYRQVRMLFTGIFLFLGVIVLFMVVMSSANTLLMAMFERTREIGTMLAMGTPRSWIVGLFVLEAVITGVGGALAGVAAGNVLGALLNRANLQLPPPPGNTVSMAFRVLHEPALMAGASVLVVCTLALASVLPAIRASRLQIAEALAHI
jgi:putative ABC transport system permease protein